MASIEASTKKLSRGEARTTKGKAELLPSGRKVITAPVENRLLQDAASEIVRLKNEINEKNS
jgi:hypothetical protein